MSKKVNYSRTFYDFGKLKKNAVYIRRGSSTEVADPDEVAKMGALSIRETLRDLPSSSRPNRIIEALRRDLEEGNVLLVEKMINDHNSFRMQCKVAEVNDLFAIFSEVKNPQNQVSGAIDKMGLSYEPAMRMKLVTITRV